MDEVHLELAYTAYRSQNVDQPLHIKTVGLKSDQYDLIDGVLYLKDDLDELIGDYDSPSTYYYKFYRIHIKFPLMVEYSGKYESLALSQSVQFSIMDYFNQFTFAETTAQMISEIGYTTTMTIVSTLIAAPASVLGSYAVAGYFGGFSQASSSLGRQLASSVLLSPLKEAVEEVVIDGLIEALSENIVDIFGLDPEIGFWASSILTGGRETLSNVGTLVQAAFKADMRVEIRQNIATYRTQQFLKMADSNADSNVAENDLEQELRKLLEQTQAQQDQKASLLERMKTFVRANWVKGLTLITASFMPFGLSIAAGLEIFNVPDKAQAAYINHKVDAIVNTRRKFVEKYYNVEDTEAYLKGFREQVKLNPYKAYVEFDDPEVETFLDNMIAVQTSPDVNPDPATATVRTLVEDYLQSKAGEEGYRAPTEYEQAWMDYAQRKEQKVREYREQKDRIQVLEGAAASMQQLEEMPSGSQVLFETPSEGSKVAALDPVFWITRKAKSGEEITSKTRVIQRGNPKFWNLIENVAAFRGMDPKRGKVVVYAGQVLRFNSPYTTADGEKKNLDSSITQNDILKDLGYPAEQLAAIPVGDVRWKSPIYRMEIYYADDPILDETLEIRETEFLKEDMDYEREDTQKKKGSKVLIEELESKYGIAIQGDHARPQGEALDEVVRNTYRIIKKKNGLDRYAKLFFETEGGIEFLTKVYDFTNEIMGTMDIKGARSAWVTQYKKIWETNPKYSSKVSEKRVKKAAKKLFDDRVKKLYENDKQKGDFFIRRNLQVLLLTHLLYEMKVDHPVTKQKVSLDTLEVTHPELVIQKLKEFISGEGVEGDGLMKDKEFMTDLHFKACIISSLSSGVFRGKFLKKKGTFTGYPSLEPGNFREMLDSYIFLAHVVLDVLAQDEDLELQGMQPLMDFNALDPDLKGKINDFFSTSIFSLRTDISYFDVFGKLIFKNKKTGKIEEINIESKSVGEVESDYASFGTAGGGKGSLIDDQSKHMIYSGINIIIDEDFYSGMRSRALISDPRFNLQEEFRNNPEAYIIENLKDLDFLAKEGITGFDIGLWQKVFKAHNMKKGFFDSINTLLYYQYGLDLSGEDLEGFAKKIKALSQDEGFIKSLKVLLEEKGHIKSVKAIKRALAEVSNNIEDYYGSFYVYENGIQCRFGLSLSGTNDIYFKGSDFEVGLLSEEIRQKSGIDSEKGPLKGTWSWAYRLTEGGILEYKLVEVVPSGEGFLISDSESLKGGWNLGFADEKGHIFPQALAVLDGERLLGRITLESGNPSFEEKWYKNKELWNKLQIDGEIYGVELVSVLSSQVGKSNKFLYHTCEIYNQFSKYGIEQDLSVILFESISDFPSSRLSKLTKEEVMISELYEEDQLSDRVKKDLKVLRAIFQRLERNPGHRPWFIPFKEFLNLDLSVDIYSISQMTEGVKKLLEDYSGDGLMAQRNKLFRAHLDKGYAEVTKDSNEDLLTQDEFYVSWREIIVNDLAKDDPSGLFGDSLSGLPEFTGNREIDMKIIKRIDNALIQAFGYPAFICLLSGILGLTIGENDEMRLDFICHKQGIQAKLWRRFGIAPLHYAHNPLILSSYYLHTRDEYHAKRGNRFPLSAIFYSLFVDGFKRIYKSGDLSYRKSSSYFIQNLFQSYSIENWRKASYTSQLALNTFYTNLEKKEFDDMAFSGRLKIFTLLSKKVPELVEKKYLSKYKPEGDLVENLDSVQQERLKRDQKNAVKLLMLFTFDPTMWEIEGISYGDPISQVGEMFSNGKSNDVVRIKALPKGGTGYVQLYQASEILCDGIEIPITQQEIRELGLDGLLAFNYFSTKSGDEIRVKNFYQNFDMVWNEERKAKIVNYIDRIMQLVSDVEGALKGKKYLNGPEWSLKLYSDKGSGVSNRLLTSKSTAYDDILATSVKGSIQPKNLDDVRSLIASMAVYLHTFPQAFAGIFIGKKPLLYADIHGLRSPNYIVSSEIDTLSLYYFIFNTHDEFDQALYNEAVEDFEKDMEKSEEERQYFGLSDVVHVLACHNHEAVNLPHIFDYIYEQMAEYLGEKYGGELEIYDLRKPMAERREG